MGALRVVLDTNVYVSALGFGGPPLDALLRTFDDDTQLLASPETISELERVMTYDRLPFTDADRSQFSAILQRVATVVRPEPVDDIVRDPDDHKFVAVAVAGEADYIVSGDDDLIDLGSYEEIDIVTPDEFVDLFD